MHHLLSGELIILSLALMEKNVFRLFVYGSLRSGFHHPAYEYISKYFKFLSNAKVKGYLYDMGNFPAAIPTTDEAYLIGELYELKNTADFSWAIEQLDDYEGVLPEEGEVCMYRREVTTVLFSNDITEAWIYWFNGTIDHQPIISSGDVLQFIHQKSKL
jgi:gamma-glutamylcyclotransferase (GGCT)/AIG2-like uncharacterized protein YtfP